mmetsp:Transcript_2237/g.2156  ORF Transcript_2237/g.2156 Transcript_2237/m.2156 type:complete len:106 (-) Transcript_2237:167-484(-)
MNSLISKTFSLCSQIASTSSTFTIRRLAVPQLNLCNSMGTKALIKTNKSAAKRLRVRGSGSIVRNKGGGSHNTGYKKRGRSNRLGQSTGIKEPAIEKRMRRLICK